MSTTHTEPRPHARTAQPPVASQEEWQAARDALLVQEKAHTRAGDAIAAQRRRLPMMRIEGDWQLEGPDGPMRLIDLFEGRRQLLLYHHMLKPGDDSPCAGCSAWGDGVGELSHMHVHDATFAMVAVAPIDEIEAYQHRMGWTFPFYSAAGTTFDEDLNPSGPGSFGVSVFLRDGDEVYRTYTTQARGAEKLTSGAEMLDILPFGRQESWEDSPEGWPQAPTYSMGALHDEYSNVQLAGLTAPSSAGTRDS